MRVFCPSCSEPINIADDLAGKQTTCPLCHASFIAPALFSSAAPTTVPSAAPVTTAPLTNSPPATSFSATAPATSAPPPLGA